MSILTDVDGYFTQPVPAMKFSLPIVATFLSAFAAGTYAADSEAAKDTTGQTVTLEFAVDYALPHLPNVGPRDLAEVYNEQDFTIAYSFTNNEDKDISIVGVGGAFHDVKTGAIKSNLTASPIETVVVTPGESGSFSHKVSLNLVPDEYILVPQLFIAFDNDLKLVQARGQRIEVKDVPISIFDPQLLFLEAILLATFTGLGYVAYNIWGKRYFEGTAMVNKPKRGASPPAATAKSVDSDWLPEGHLRQKKTKKAN